MDKLMVVAHPDDESLFGGATLLRSPGWFVLCLTGWSNETRRSEFRRACQVGEFEGVMLDYPDGWLDTSFDSSEGEETLAAVVRKHLREAPSLVLTHGPEGEYAHPQHLAAHQLVKRVFPGALFFSQGSPLPEYELVAKTRLLDVYQSQAWEISQHMSWITHEQVVE